LRFGAYSLFISTNLTKGHSSIVLDDGFKEAMLKVMAIRSRKE